MYLKRKLKKMRKVGFTCGAFDLCHAGHIQMLQEARGRCDYLICGLHVDPSAERESKSTPIQTIVERYIQLMAVKYVDEVVPYCTETDLLDIFTAFPIDIRIIGEEYKNVEFTGKTLCRELGIEVYFNTRSHRFSSTNLRDQLEKSI